MKKNIEKKNQLKLIDQATDSAMKQVEKERGQKKQTIYMSGSDISNYQVKN